MNPVWEMDLRRALGFLAGCFGYASSPRVDAGHRSRTLMLRGGWMAVLALLVTRLAGGAEPGAVAEAAMNSDLPTLYGLLKQGANPNAPGPFGTPALHWRVRVDDLETTQRLLKARADPNGLTE